MVKGDGLQHHCESFKSSNLLPDSILNLNMNIKKLHNLLKEVSDETLASMIKDTYNVEINGTYEANSALVLLANKFSLIIGDKVENVIPYLTVSIFREFSYRTLKLNDL